MLHISPLSKSRNVHIAWRIASQVFMSIESYYVTLTY